MRKGYAELAIAMVFYGLTYPLTVMALKGVTPIHLTTLRSLWSFLFFVAYFLKKGYPRKNFNYPLLAAIALSGIIVPIYLQNYGMLYTTASMASIIQSTAPMFVVFMAFLILKEKMSIGKIFGLLLGIFGTVLVVFEGLIDGSGILGNVLIFLSALSFAFLAIFEKVALSQNHAPIEILGITSIMGFPPLMLISLAFEGPSIPPFDSLVYAAIISLLCTVLPYFLWLDALKKIEVSQAIIFTYGIPVFGILFSILLLGEGLSIIAVIGMAIIFLSIWLAQR